MPPRGSMQQMGFGIPPFTKGVKWLVIATVATSVLVPLLKNFAGISIEAYVALVPELVLHSFSWARLHGFFWTPLTYTFLEREPLDLIFSLLALWLIGSTLEQRWGTRKFVVFYFATAVFAALATLLLGAFLPAVGVFPYVGNWGVIEAMVAATAIQLPDVQFFLYLFFVRAKWMLPISAGTILLYVIIYGPVRFIPVIFGLLAGLVLSGGVRTPKQLMLRARVWWIDRRMRKSNLRVVRGGQPDDLFGGRGKSGSDKYLH